MSFWSRLLHRRSKTASQQQRQRVSCNRAGPEDSVPPAKADAQERQDREEERLFLDARLGILERAEAFVVAPEAVKTSVLAQQECQQHLEACRSNFPSPYARSDLRFFDEEWTDYRRRAKYCRRTLTELSERLRRELSQLAEDDEVYNRLKRAEYDIPILSSEKLQSIIDEWNYGGSSDYSSCGRASKTMGYAAVLEQVFQMQREKNSQGGLSEAGKLCADIRLKIKLHDGYIEYRPGITCDGFHTGYLICRTAPDGYVVLQYTHEHS